MKEILTTRGIVSKLTIVATMICVWSCVGSWCSSFTYGPVKVICIFVLPFTLASLVKVTINYKEINEGLISDQSQCTANS